MRILLALCLVALPLAPQAQEVTRGASPMLVVGAQAATTAPSTPTAPAAAKATATATTPAPAAAQPVLPNFPDWAVTSVGEKTFGQSNGVVPPPTNPPAPQAPANAASSATPTSPAAPASPANPINKLWPRDTVPIFLQSCAGLHLELVAPCTCVISNLMLGMPHDEFLAESEKGTVESDPRVIKARADCIATPQRRE